MKCTSTYLQEGNDEWPQWEVSGLVKFGVKLFDGESGVLAKRGELDKVWTQESLSNKLLRLSYRAAKVTKDYIFFILFTQGPDFTQTR